MLSKTAVSEAISGSRAVHTCCCSYYTAWRETWLGPTKHNSRKYIATREIPGINLSRTKVCSVYHVLRKCTPGDRAVYLGSPYLQHRVATLLVQHGRRHQNHSTGNPFLKPCRFRLWSRLCCCQLVSFEFGVLHFRLPIPETGRL